MNHYHKLVRDKIPQIIEVAGKTRTYSALCKQENTNETKEAVQEKADLHHPAVPGRMRGAGDGRTDDVRESPDGQGPRPDFPGSAGIHHARKKRMP